MFQSEFAFEAKLSTADRDNMDTKEFGIPELRKYPLTDKKHVQSAIRLFGHAPKKYRLTLARRIKERAKELGMDIQVGNENPMKKYITESASDWRRATESTILGGQDIIDDYYHNTDKFINGLRLKAYEIVPALVDTYNELSIEKIIVLERLIFREIYNGGITDMDELRTINRAMTELYMSIYMTNELLNESTRQLNTHVYDAIDRMESKLENIAIMVRMERPVNYYQIVRVAKTLPDSSLAHEIINKSTHIIRSDNDLVTFLTYGKFDTTILNYTDHALVPSVSVKYDEPDTSFGQKKLQSKFSNYNDIRYMPEDEWAFDILDSLNARISPESLSHIREGLTFDLNVFEVRQIMEAYKNTRVVTYSTQMGGRAYALISYNRRTIYLMMKKKNSDMLYTILVPKETDIRNLSITGPLNILTKIERITATNPGVDVESMDISSALEGFTIDGKGNIKYTKDKNKSYMDRYMEIHKFVILNAKSNNLDALKNDLVVMFALINEIERDVIYKGNVDQKKKHEAIRARAFALNDFKTYSKVIIDAEPGFDFMEYFKKSEAGMTVINISEDNIKGIKSVLKAILL